jgi:hypothetical protein
VIGDPSGGPRPRRSRLGVLVGYVGGKRLGIVGTALLVTWLSRGRLHRLGNLVVARRDCAPASIGHLARPRLVVVLTDLFEHLIRALLHIDAYSAPKFQASRASRDR